MIKLFASDLDGTLLNAMHETDGFIRRAIGEVIDAGAHVVPATGRAYPPAGPHGFDGLAVETVCANGSIVRGRNGELLHASTIDKAFIEELLKEFPQICFSFVAPEGSYLNGSREQHDVGFKKDGLLQRIIMRGMRSRENNPEEFHFDQDTSEILSHDICKINVRVTDGADERSLAAFLADHADTVVNAPFNPVMFEITDKDVNKGASIAWLGRYLGIDESEIAVYGDGGNDIEMLKRFKHAFATKNGTDDAKAAAGTIIGSCTFHAVPKHMLATMHTQCGRTVIE